jgi:hypothetical protein
MVRPSRASLCTDTLQIKYTCHTLRTPPYARNSELRPRRGILATLSARPPTPAILNSDHVAAGDLSGRQSGWWRCTAAARPGRQRGALFPFLSRPVFSAAGHFLVAAVRPAPAHGLTSALPCPRQNMPPFPDGAGAAAALCSIPPQVHPRAAAASPSPSPQRRPSSVPPPLVLQCRCNAARAARTPALPGYPRFSPSPSPHSLSSNTAWAYGVEIYFSPSASKNFYSVHPH